jgi:peptide/nickel transport system substrate-binding protein
LIEAFFKRFKLIIIFGIILGIIVFLIISFLIPNLDSTNRRIGIAGRYTTDSIPDELTTKLSEGLTSVDQNGNVGPSIAKSWESPDGGKTWIFKIDTNKKWQDGKKVKASDIIYEFSDATSEAVDDQTIKFSLNNQFAAFPVIVSKPLLKSGLVGLGDWKVSKLSLSGGYLQKIDIKDTKSNKITYKFYPSEDRLKLAFKLGEIDEMYNLQEIDTFLNWKTINITKDIGYNNFVGIFFNTDDENLKSKELRQSLAYAINKDGFDGERAIGPVSPLSWGYNPQVKQYIRDVEKAKDAKDTKITLSTLPNLLKTAEKIKKDWDEVGVICDIQVVTDVPDNYQAFLATVDIPKDPDQYSLWHSTQMETNISHFKNPRIDKLLEDGRTELDQEVRKKIYLDFQRFIVEDVPAVFLYHPTFYSVTRK